MTERGRLGIGLLLVLVLGVALYSIVSRDEASPIADVEEALGAWAEFAANGELEVVEGYFASDGPQYRRLALEAVKRGSRYAFDFDRAEVVSPLLVAGDVIFARNGRVILSARWEFELRRRHGRYQIWTVRTVPG